MYEKFFGFSVRPFQMAPDPQFLFLSAQHRAALLQLEYAMTHDAPFCLITGEIGSGKTTLIRHLLNKTESTLTVGLINNTSRDIRQLMQWVSLAFDLPFEGRSEVGLRKQFEEFLIREYAAGRRCVLIVDEAQNLGRRNLEELRLLSNINADQDLLLQTILVGQPELRGLLADPRLQQVAQRISVEFHIGALSAEEAGHYIRHRLRIAGGPLSTFSSNAVRLIYLRSEGVPRLINRICDLSLVHAFSLGERRVGHEIVAEAARGITPGRSPRESVRSV
jgi:type II secretory pathway predicted ATPase ExeA